LVGANLRLLARFRGAIEAPPGRLSAKFHSG
jgi:hypothetical protein